MEGPKPPSTEFDWSQPRTSRPLKDFRPQLATDPRNIVARVCRLTLEDSSHQALSTTVRPSKTRNGKSRRSVVHAFSSVNSGDKAQQRLEQKRAALAESLSSKYNSRIISNSKSTTVENDYTNCLASPTVISDFSSSLIGNKIRSSEQKRVTFADDLPQRYDSHIIDDKVENDNFLNFEESCPSLLAGCSEERPLSSQQKKHSDSTEILKLNKSSTPVKPQCSSETKPHQDFAPVNKKNIVLNSHTIYGSNFVNQKNTAENQLKKFVQANYHVRKPLNTQYYWRFRSHASKHPDYDQDSGVDSPKSGTPVPSLDASICSDNDLEGVMDKNIFSIDQSSDQLSDIDSLDQSSISTLDDSVCLNPEDAAPQPFPLIAVPERLRKHTSIMSGSVSSGNSSGVSSLNQSERDDSCSPSSSRSLSPVPKFSDCQKSHEKVVASWKASFSASSMKGPVRSSCNFAQKDSRTTRMTNQDWNDASSMSAMGLPSSFGTPNGMKRKAVDSPRTDASFEEMTNMYFSKQYNFQSSDWRLPDPTMLFTSDVWELEDFISLKESLNAVKDELNDFPLQEWHTHTRRRNKAGNVIWQLRNKIDPEFPTQAWCKFYENASTFPLVPQKAIDQKCLNSLHLCEAPGAFITSLNHFLHVNYGSDFKFDWRAVTLNPYYEGNPLSCMINDDRLILKTFDKWLFGKDNTGDLMNKENLLDIIKKSSELEEILLITADGSIDCQNNPAEQEDIVSCLHYCETVAALHMLAAGGSFLIKMFTFYEQSSICLLYLLNCMFKNVTVNKPATSKEGNSEVYVVCCGYKGVSVVQPWLDVLMSNYGPKTPTKALFALKNLPHSFLDAVYNCADFFRKLQTDVIEENVRSYKSPQRRDNSYIAKMRHRVAEKFFSRYKIRKMDREFYLVDKQALKVVTTPNIDPKIEEGSFNDRRKRLTLSQDDELECLRDDLIHLNVKWPGDFDVFWLDFPPNPQGFKIVRGKPITKVNSSKFCLGRLLKIRNRVREIAYDKTKAPVLLNPAQSDDRVFPWPDEPTESVKRKVFKLNFKNVLWASLEDGSNAVHEKDACRKILSVIENEIFRDDCLELQGYPLLTQFNVGLVYLLGHLFEKVGFIKPLGQDIRVIFFKYRNFHPEMKKHWDQVVSEMDHGSDAVLSVVQISELSEGDFYKYVTEINNLCVVEQIKDLLNAMGIE